MFRPILPSPEQSQPQSQSPTQVLKSSLRPLSRRCKQIALACGPCRLRKTRCDGARPKCSRCVRRKTECQYQDSPPAQRGPYEELIRVLATTSHHEGSDILRRLRSGDDVETILRHIQQAHLLPQLHVVPDHYYQFQFPYCKDMPKLLIQEGNHYLDSWLYKYSLGEARLLDNNESSAKYPIIYQVPSYAAEMIDPRLDDIKARKWTSIIDDNKLLRRLLQTYFMTEYTFFPAFQKDYFLGDMASGSKKNCSSLLVNAILAAACHGYSKVDHRSRFWNPRTLGYQFLAEARRLWELEIGRARLTTIQAAVVLSIVCDANGSDEVGRAYLTQAVAAAYGMQLFSAHVKTNDDREYNARAVTAWGLFGLQAVHSFHVFKAPLLHMPPSIPLPDPSQQDDCYGDFWLRYPSSKVPVPVNYSNTFKAISEFRVIMNDVAAMFFSDFQITPDVATDRIQGFCIRLDSWHQNLPRDLKAREICFPWQLKLDMHYYHVIIFLLETLCKTSTSALHDQSIQKALSDAKIKMETLLRLYYLRHGFESYDIFLISLLSFLGFMHIKSLKSAEAMELESRRSTVVLMAKGLRDQSQNCFLAALVFRVLKAKMGRESQLLLKEVDVGEEDGEEDGEEEVVMADQVHSSWPIDIEWIDTDPDKQRLGNLIKETKGLRVC